MANNPNITFGEVSRIVGTEWKKLTAHEKNVWEEKAARVNEESLAKMERGETTTPAPPPPAPPSVPRTYVPPVKLPDQVWECLWDNCDFMFEDQLDCLDHAVADQKGHVSSWFANLPNKMNGEYQCQWRNCARIKKESPPFPSLHRLIRHVKEVHIMKNTGRVVPPSERSERFVPSKRNLKNTVTQMTTTTSTTTSTTVTATLTVASTNAASTQGTSAISTSTTQASQEVKTPKKKADSTTSSDRISDPLFVVVPPRPNRVLHSVIYLRYIENLSAERPAQVSNWENQLHANVDSVPSPDPEKLPSHWLQNGAGNHGSELNALWALRDYMMQDALNLSRTNVPN